MCASSEWNYGPRSVRPLISWPIAETDPEVKLRSISALATAAGVYMKIAEASEFESRLTALEHRVPLRRVL